MFKVVAYFCNNEVLADKQINSEVEEDKTNDKFDLIDVFEEDLERVEELTPAQATLIGVFEDDDEALFTIWEKYGACHEDDNLHGYYLGEYRHAPTCEIIDHIGCALEERIKANTTDDECKAFAEEVQKEYKIYALADFLDFNNVLEYIVNYRNTLLS